MQTSTPKDEEIVLDPLPSLDTKITSINYAKKAWRLTLEGLREKYKETFQQGERQQSAVMEDNSTLMRDNLTTEYKGSFYVKPIINRETLLTDIVVKSIAFIFSLC